MATRKKELAFRLTLLLAGVTVALLLAEAAMIVLEPQLSRGFYVYDPDLGFRVRENTATTNRFGFFDRDYPLERDSTKYRILILGDSFNWSGGTQEHNYTSVLERLFAANYPGAVEVINAGYPMTHTAEQLAILRKYALQYEPDLVILGFFTGNDFYDGDPTRKRIVVNETYHDVDPDRFKTVFGYPLVGRSRLYWFLKQRVRVWREELGARADLAATSAKRSTAPDIDALARNEALDAGLARLARECPPETTAKPTFAEDTYGELKASHLRFWLREEHQEKDFATEEAYILGAFREMARLLEEGDIAFMVGLYPDEFQVDPETLASALRYAGRPAGHYDLTKAQRLIKQAAEESGVPWIDFLEPLRIAHLYRATYHPRDTHWNRYGNCVVGHVYFLALEAFVREGMG